VKEEMMGRHKNSGKPDEQQALKKKAGVVVYSHRHGDEPFVLIVTSRKVAGSWVFPVGGVKKGESLKAAAKRECLEESGYHVDIGPRLSPVEISKENITTRFTFYLATVVGEAETWEMDRTRDWLPVSKLADMLPDIFRGVAHEAVQLIAKGNKD